MLFMTKIVLPTVDVVTDCLTVEKVFSTVSRWSNFDYYQERVPTLIAIGCTMIFFMVLSFAFMIPQYFRVEKTQRQKLHALPFLLTSTWPQYRAMRLLWWSFIDVNEEKCRLEKLELDQEISNIGRRVPKTENEIEKFVLVCATCLQNVSWNLFLSFI